jgi:hypothetical protein
MLNVQKATSSGKKWGDFSRYKKPLKSIIREQKTADSSLECARLQHGFWGFIQSPGKALGTGTEFPQIFKRVDTGFVTIAPPELQGVIANRRNAYSLHC